MAMQTLADFFAMGGYADFVWPAYGLTFVVLLGTWLDSLLRLRRRQRALAQLERTRPEGRRRPMVRTAPAP